MIKNKMRKIKRETLRLRSRVLYLTNTTTECFCEALLSFAGFYSFLIFLFLFFISCAFEGSASFLSMWVLPFPRRDMWHQKFCVIGIFFLMEKSSFLRFDWLALANDIPIFSQI